MATDYKAKQGECIVSIAYAHNLPWEKVWNDPRNAELREKRKDPNVIRAGDVVHIPDITPARYSIATGAHHRFVLKRPKARLKLRVVLDPGPKPAPGPAVASPTSDRRNDIGEDPEPNTAARPDEPRGGLAFRLEVDGVAQEGVTDSDGYVDCEIAPNAMSGRLVLAPGTPHETVVSLRLGHLDPIDAVSGVKQRLRNLCFDCGEQGDEETPDLEAALRAFQTKHGLSATGRIDDATRTEILKAHGA